MLHRFFALSLMLPLMTAYAAPGRTAVMKQIECTLPSIERLYARITSYSAAAQITMNGEDAGSIGGGSITIGLSSCGAWPGRNVLGVSVSGDSKAKLVITFLNASSTDDKKPVVLHEIVLTGRDFSDAITFPLVIACKGHYPEAEPLLEEYDALVLAQFKKMLPDAAMAAQMANQKRKSLRGELVDAKNAQEAKKIVSEAIRSLR